MICVPAMLLISMLAGCGKELPDTIEPSPTPAPIVSPSPTPEPMPTPTPSISNEERKRMDLYIAAIRDTFGRENGGDGFIAIDTDTLEGISDQAKAIRSLVSERRVETEMRRHAHSLASLAPGMWSGSGIPQYRLWRG